MISESNHPHQAELPPEEAPGRGGAGRNHFTNLAAALDNAQERASEIEIRRPILDFLYGKTRCESLTRTEWERQVRVATAFDENLTRFGSARLLKQVADQLAVPRRTAAASGFAFGPVLALTYHGGFSVMLRRSFGHLFPGSVVIGANSRYAARDGAFALFAAREALLEGRSVLTAPDGRFGKESVTVPVLGAQLLVTDGAPFLAHTTDCKVMWFAPVWTGRRFEIETMPGPQRGAGEAFADYRKRFYQFYVDRLEHAFTGDPANLPLTINWKFIFNAMLAGKVHRFRHPTR